MIRAHASSLVATCLISTTLLAGCGDDDDTSPEVTNADFCAALGDFDAVSPPAGSNDPTAEDMTAYAAAIRPAVDTIVAGAPPSVAAAATTLDDATDQAATGDISGAADPVLHRATEDLQQAARHHCSITTFDVTATDFSFDAPASVPAGPLSIRMINRGRAFHVLLLVRAPDDGTDDATFIDQFLAAASASDRSDNDDDPFAPFARYEVAGNMPAAAPGSSGTAIHRLPPGTYLYFCPIPLGDPSGPTHADKGMHGRLTVTAGPGSTP